MGWSGVGRGVSQALSVRVVTSGNVQGKQQKGTPPHHHPPHTLSPCKKKMARTACVEPFTPTPPPFRPNTHLTTTRTTATGARTAVYLSHTHMQGVGVRYAYAVTVRVRRTLPPPPAAGRLLGLVRRRSAAGSSASPGFSTTDVHVAFTVLSEGSGVMMAAAGGPGAAQSLTNGCGDDDVCASSGAGIFYEGWGGSGSGWGRVAFAELETERQPRGAFELEAERAKAGGLVSGTRAVTWNMQVW